MVRRKGWSILDYSPTKSVCNVGKVILQKTIKNTIVMGENLQLAEHMGRI